MTRDRDRFRDNIERMQEEARRGDRVLDGLEEFDYRGHRVSGKVNSNSRLVALLDRDHSLDAGPADVSENEQQMRWRLEAAVDEFLDGGKPRRA